MQVNASVLVANNTLVPVQGEAIVVIEVGIEKNELPVRLINALDYDCILGVDFHEWFKFEINFGKSTWKTSVHSETPFGGPWVPRDKENSNSEAPCDESAVVAAVEKNIPGEGLGLSELFEEERAQVGGKAGEETRPYT